MTGNNRIFARFSAISASIVLLASAASAQTPTTASPATTAAGPSLLSTPAFASLVVGKTMIITTTDGWERQGRVQSVSDTAVIIDGKSLTLDQIVKVQKPSYRIRKGVLIGLGAGLGAGALWYASYVTAGEYCGDCGAATLLFGGLGAGIGAGLGGLLQHARRDDDVIFKRTPRTTTIAFAPIVSPTRKGAGVSITWR